MSLYLRVSHMVPGVPQRCDGSSPGQTPVHLHRSDRSVRQSFPFSRDFASEFIIQKRLSDEEPSVIKRR